MKKISVRVPMRADLSGGTLDLWPIYLFEPMARTVNVAISHYAECSVTSRSDGAVEVFLKDHPHHRTYESHADLARDPHVALVWRAVEHFKLTGLRIVTRTDAPRGSGLGGSSALAIAVVRALAAFADETIDGDDLIALARDLETRLLGLPAGIQDYYPPVYGGLAAIHLKAGRVVRHPIPIPLPELADHLIVHYTGVSHFSGTNNWEIYKRFIDGDSRVRELLSEIAAASVAMEESLESGNFSKAGAALAREWKARTALIDGISTPEIDQAIGAAVKAGAWGGKVCGAGGGGCVVFLTPKTKRSAVLKALASVPGSTLDVHAVAHGMEIEQEDDSQPVLSFLSKRARVLDSIEQLYHVSADKSDYRPYVLAEGAVTYDEPRSGVHHTIVRSLAAPIDAAAARVAWDTALTVSADDLQLVATPDPRQSMKSHDSDAIAAIVASAEDSFRQHLVDNERLKLEWNPAFELCSEPNETRESFLQRCIEKANHALEDVKDQLETTVRRRFDQMRERSDREQRMIAESEEAMHDQKSPEVAIAWGQALYNITSGKPATLDLPQSVNEADYMKKIAQLQKLFERELEEKKDELLEKARAIEELIVAPSLRNIDVQKLLIIWSSSLKSPKRRPVGQQRA